MLLYKSTILLSALATSTAFSPSPSRPTLRLRVSSSILTTLHSEKDNNTPFFATEIEEEPNGTANTNTNTKPRGVSQQIMDEASDALVSVGWSAPMMEAELTSDDPFVKRINDEIQKEFGVTLDELLNPAKVVNLERDLVNLRAELAVLTGNTLVDPNNAVGMTTADADNGGGGEEADKIRKTIDKKEKDLLIERRSVFRGWLKNVFLGQAILSLGLSWIMVTDPSILFGQFDWFQNTRSIDVSIQVLGFWWWWLFIVPSLRSRRPRGFEKKALDIAFIGTPAVSLLAPVLTKDTPTIWIANFVLVAGAYAFAKATYNEDEGGDDDSKDPEWLKFIVKSLDFGTGRERGARQ